ncbi:DNA topoisomerase IV subunit B, partial [candidate division WWE3 bacterium]|nr:DNA topoisomerase IV subunit B [candidate division WWE3 bacterium]
DYAYLTAGLRFYLIDDRDAKKQTNFQFYFEGGIRSFVKYINRHHHPFMQDPFFISKDTLLTDNDGETINVEVAVQYHDEYHSELMSFVNNIHTHEGGTHEVGFKSALTRVVNDYARKEKLLDEKDENLNGDDIREGMTAIISIKMSSKDLQFEGQTKRKLGNPEIRTAVEVVMGDAFGTYLAEHPSEAKQIINKAVLAQEARKAAKKARETVLRKSALASSALPGKLVDCREKDPEKSEIFVVEGDSAGGSAKSARDSNFQAVLYLGGKPINTEKNRLDKVLANERLRDIIISLGVGIGDEFSIENLRYHRVILAFDADVDGEHITTLVLTFFYRQMRELIEGGYIYISQPPLYRVKVGQKIEHAFSDTERDEVVKRLTQETGVKRENVNIQRFKGLGEMNPEQLWDTTMNPETRIIKQVTVEDAAISDQTFSMLMGDDVLPRKRFIQTHAKTATLDV